MMAVSELTQSLNAHFNWHKSRITCFANMLLALLTVRSINLREIAIAFESKALLDSRHKRVKRFFKSFTFDLTVIARWIFNLFGLENKTFYITIDRSNWYLGKKKINIFMLGIAWEGIAIPLIWMLLPKAGSSNFNEQKKLIEKFVTGFGKQGIAGLLADREFASGNLFNWLNKESIPFYIRIKNGTQVGIKGRKLFAAKKIFRDLNLREKKIFHTTVEVFGQTVYLAGSRSHRGEWMIVATNQKPQNAIAIYLRRWEIECLFSVLKTRGFYLENTHITEQERLEKLIALLAIAVAWAHKIGEWRAKIKPIVLNQYRESKRPQYSYFRYGLDFIRELLLNPRKKIKRLKQVLQLLIFPTWPRTESNF